MGAVQNFVSVSRRPPDIEDYIDIMRRYRSWIIAPMFTGLVISVVVAFLWPDTYESTAVMRITPQQVSERLVPADVATHMGDRLNQMEQEILSRGQLSSIILQPSLNLYPKQRQQRPMEDIVTDMRNNDIGIKMLDLPGARNDADHKLASAFSISFKYTDKYKAQAVVRELVTKFTEQNITVLRNQAQLTSTFLDDELKNAKDKLDSMDAKITRWKSEHAGQLPEQASANVTALNSMQLTASQAAEALAQAQASKAQLETSLQNYQGEVAYYSQHAEEIQTIPGQSPQSVKNDRLVELNRNLIQAQSDLASLRKQYKDSYPLIGALQARIDLLQEQRDAAMKEEAKAEETSQQQGASSAPTQVRVSNPLVQERLQELKNTIQSTKTTIVNMQQQIDSRQRQIGELNKRIAEYQGRIDASPLNEQQYAQLMGDYNLAKQAYDLQVKKSEEAATAQNLEDHKAGETLEVLDPASLPEESIEPKRPAWIGVGTALGLMLGIVLAAAKEVRNTSLKNLKDVRAYTNLPVLSSIPLLENALLVRRKRRLFWLAWSSAFIVGVIAMSGAMYYRYFGRS